MIYSNKNIRRQDRLLGKETALEILEKGEYGVLSICSNDNSAYGIPLNYVWDKENIIYIHCAPEGQKLEMIRNNNKLSFCVVGQTNIVSNKFTTAYESIVIQCEARLGLSEEERMKALSLFLSKYSPEDKEIGMKYAAKSFHRTEIIRLEIINISGKSKDVR
ncbi:MAG: pyridoxamine 5'-phosphate oxidase family protein [Marinifilaceae bacterium]|jgi:nitroimidazol reductase NimA-like FMN-containing flavoprotein (pyridoxamine 5'-phosphate oxidase superfamily)|nr:pyridoxamine 5'-phosphate oxidase family protein [Marinifilaceae bacterium]